MPKVKTWEEYRAECEAVAKPGITVLGWIGEWQGARTKLNCYCATHGEWKTTTIHGFKNKQSCPKCGLIKKTSSRKKTWEEHLKECLLIAKPGIRILGVSGEFKGSNTRIVCSCADHGEWETTITSFKGGHSCPDCGKLVTRAKSWDTYKEEIEKILPDNLRLIGWCGSWKGHYTKLELYCSTHDFTWCSSNIDSIKNGGSCLKCSREAVTKATRLTDEQYVEQILLSGAFLEGTQFRRSDRENAEGHKLFWEYICPVCSYDEYVNAGVCTGVFEGRLANLKRGERSCRCSKIYRYSKEQWDYRLKKGCELRNYRFMGWSGSRWGNKGRFKYLCFEHGVHVTTPGHFLMGKGCPQCKGQNQKQAYINIVKDGTTAIALKFGISKDSARRLYEQNLKNLFQMEQSHVYKFPSVQQCKAAEKACKDDLQCGILSYRELKDGWSETTFILNLDKIIEIYERFGGKRVK